MSTEFKLKNPVLASAVAAALASNAAVAQLKEITVIEEVVVTATKREASAQDIPLSITAVSGETLNELQITNILQLNKTVPGMFVLNRGNDPTIIMRGAGAAGVNDLAVPLYIDGLYRPRAGQALASYLDIERVEVLRGPQGTLFGRNTLGGLVNLIAKKPNTGELEYGAALTLGDYEYQRLEGFVNVPMGSQAAVRLTVSNTQQDPFVENNWDSGAGLKDEDNTYARLQFTWAPNDRLDVTFTGTYWDDSANGNSDYAYKVLGIPINSASGQTNGVNGVLQPRQGVQAGYGGGKEFTGVYPVNSTAHNISDPYEVAFDFQPQRNIEETSFSMLLNFDAGFANLRANIGYFDYEESRLTDSDISANPTLHGNENGTFNEFCVDYGFAEGPWWHWDSTTQQRCGIAAGERSTSKALQADINLNSNGDGPFQWTAGYFLYDDSDADDSTYEFVYGYVNSANPQRPRWAHWLSASAGGAKSQALYGQAEYSLTDKLRVTTGLRYSRDERNYYSAGLIEESRLEPWPRFDLNEDSLNDGEDDHVDWRLAFQYDLSDGVMVYASVATGYISGEPIRAGSTKLSDPNEVEAYELGIKSTLLDGSMVLNAALYQNDYEGLSTTTFVQQGGTIIAQSAPGGALKARGLEADLTWLPTPTLRMTLGLSLDDSELQDFTEGESRFSEGGDATDGAGNRFYILDGAKPRFTPDYTLSFGITYDVNLGDKGTLVPGAYLYHTDDYKTQNVEYFFAQQDAYTTIDLRLSWMPGDGAFSAMAYVKNLTEEEYLTETTVFSGARAFADFAVPRTYGIRLGYQF